LLSILPSLFCLYYPRLLSAGGASLADPFPNWIFHGTNDADNDSNMKAFALGVLLSLVLNAQGFAIIRPPYPMKPFPPYHGRFIVIGDDAISQTVSKSPK